MTLFHYTPIPNSFNSKYTTNYAIFRFHSHVSTRFGKRCKQPKNHASKRRAFRHMAASALQARAKNFSYIIEAQRFKLAD